MAHPELRPTSALAGVPASGRFVRCFGKERGQFEMQGSRDCLPAWGCGTKEGAAGLVSAWVT